MFDDDFVLCVGYFLFRLFISCLIMVFRFDTLVRFEVLFRRFLLEINRVGKIYIIFKDFFFVIVYLMICCCFFKVN